MTKPAKLPEREMLNSLLDYNEDTGLLYWKARVASLFESGKHSAEHTCNRWNSKFAGKEAFTCVGTDGYRKGSINNHLYRAHRIIWKMLTGEEPPEVDHINGTRLDNRKVNLRGVTSTENRRNAARHRDTKSPHNGVRKAPQGGWQSYITVDYKWINLGCYSSLEEAVAARKAGELAFGFHPNHGRAAALPKEA